MTEENNKNRPLDSNSLKDLEMLVFQMTEIYQRLQHDRDRWSVISMTLTQAVDTLQHQIDTQAVCHQDHLEQLTQHIRDESRQILTTIATTVQQTTQQMFKDQVATVTTSLQKVVHQAQELFSQYKYQAQSQMWRVLFLALSSALVGSLMGGLVLLYMVR